MNDDDIIISLVRRWWQISQRFSKGQLQYRQQQSYAGYTQRDDHISPGFQ